MGNFINTSKPTNINWKILEKISAGFIAQKNWSFWLNSLTWLSFISICLGGLVSLQQPKLQKLTTSKTQLDYSKEEQLEKVRLDVLNHLPTFGFDNLVADWSLLQFIQYFADDPARQQTGYSLSPEYFNLIVKNNPRFVRAYLILSPINSIQAGRPDITVAEMEKGLQHLSPDVKEAYLVWLYKGIDEMLFLGDIEAAKKSYQMGANWAEISGDERIARISSKTVKFLQNNPDSKTAQVGAWYTVFTSTIEPKVRKRAKEEIEKLGGKLIIYPDGRISAIPPKQD